MDISYLGKDKFKIKTKTGVVMGDESVLVVSHKSGGEDFAINMPGEYEVEGISVFGYKADNSNIFVIQYEDLRVLYLGGIEKILSEKVVSELESVDVMILSVDKISTRELVELVSKLEPYYVLPYGEMTEKFIAAYEHGNRKVKSLNLSKISLATDLTEVITFE